YQQLRWDPRLDARRVVIGVETRLDGIKELGFGDFVPDGDVPWHRIWYFRDDREVLWDRRERIDRLLDRPAADAAPPAPEGPWSAGSRSRSRSRSCTSPATSPSTRRRPGAASSTPSAACSPTTLVRCWCSATSTPATIAPTIWPPRAAWRPSAWSTPGPRCAP